MSAQRRDAVVAGLLAGVLITVFALISAGAAMWWTFIPAMVIAYGCHLATTNRRPYDPDRILPIYSAALAWQFLHFAEEFMGGFYPRWTAEIFDAAPRAFPSLGIDHQDLFVWLNMIPYAAFVLCGLAMHKGLRVPMLIVWFFAIMGVMGNAISHALYALISGDLGFPGIVTSLPYWVLGPLLIRALAAGVRRQSTIATPLSA
ncbi:HXXEE domain-containing protein [Nonomuraea sp. KC401]|uniref:HXXEE domain-containing protein n=1 Tax=unclassified Nonomuraea TaxID=2593643 RepID=UPI0010FDBD57|nr:MULTISPECIES: HXXEE domain-containing protein [unclassified Nonomuraea]NBE98108.1 HXXEE domain-containing protein [Nonomuraea sp. K271]TLF60414.1 HXXEE domain-containing protein [Nonomuraea sp. KC401]